MAESEKPASEENNAQQPNAPRVKAGEMILAARKRAGLAVEKVCADLRISAATLSAIEAGEYGKLAGSPYTRALLVSLSRYLRLDSREVLQAYNDETGLSAAAPVSPYKDDSKTHARTHKQIFILIVVGLLLVLLLIVGKVSSTSPENTEPVPPATSSDTLLNIDPAGGPDSLLNDSLGLDSLVLDTAHVDTAAAAADAAADGAQLEAAKSDKAAREKAAKAKAEKEKAQAADAAEEPREETTVRILAIADSVYVRVLAAGRRERSHSLSAGMSIEVKHDDAITFITRNSGTVEVTVGGTTVVPDKRRFKVDGNAVSY